MDPHLDWMYCVADRVFFDSPDRVGDAATRFPHADRPAPAGWLRGEAELWVGLEAATSPRCPAPAQGWKLHVSVLMEHAARCLDIVWDYCLANDLSFKFLRSRDAMLLLNAKYAGRGSSGKLMTLYPRDLAHFERAVRELSPLLAGMDGPYVLGDLRIGAGPLYARYGGFAEMWCHGDGDEPVLAIANDRGELVPDRRGVVFSVPDWVEVPHVLRPHLAARRAGSGEEFPYQVERALHFSNGGGVYLARDSRGTQVILREARPHAGLDAHQVDAVRRLVREHAVLSTLAGLDCVPAVYDYRVVQGHHFLVEEYVEGGTLLREVQSRSPAMYPGTPAEQLDEQVRAYRDWAIGVLDRVGLALATVHARGVRFGDLHPGNVLLRPDGRVVFVDFEFADELTDARPAGLGAPGFAAPSGVTGAAADLHALACLRVFAFMVLLPIIELSPAKISTLARAASQVSAMPPAYGAELCRRYERSGAAGEMTAGGMTQTTAEGMTQTTAGAMGQTTAGRHDRAAELLDTANPRWPRIRDSLVAGIHASATPDRADRLFPGSPAQFRVGGFGLAYGAAGVLLALHRAGDPVPDEYVDWMIRAAWRVGERPCQGLYNGPHGVAWVLDALGRPDQARELLGLARTLDRLPTSDNLYSGRTGRALNLLHFARVTGDDALRAAAVHTAAQIAGRLRAGVWPAGHGLLRGASGPALLFVRLFEETGAEDYLELARLALEHELEQGVELADGSYQLRVGFRHVPYLDGGGGGVALALHTYLRHRDDHPDFTRALAGIRRGASAPIVFQPGLFLGRAGFIAILAHLGMPEDRAIVREHIRRLAWHALLHDGHLAFPGEQLLRLSMDLATGSAGVLLAVRAAFEETGVALPYLDAWKPVQNEVPGRVTALWHRGSESGSRSPAVVTKSRGEVKP